MTYPNYRRKLTMFLLLAFSCISCATPPLTIGATYRTTRLHRAYFRIEDKQPKGYGIRDLQTGIYFVGSGGGLKEVEE